MRRTRGYVGIVRGKYPLALVNAVLAVASAATGGTRPLIASGWRLPIDEILSRDGSGGLVFF
jgi:hypothetical protein